MNLPKTQRTVNRAAGVANVNVGLHIAATTDLLRGGVKSCGCLRADRLTKHGLGNTPIYHTWKGIKYRCFSPNCKDYKNYGGRGITMYPEWKDDFTAFYSYVSTLEHFDDEDYTLDRIDNNGGYIPGNLRFANKKTQRINQRRTIFVEYEGVKMCLGEASKRSGINKGTLRSRYHAGDTGERLFRPVEK